MRGNKYIEHYETEKLRDLLIGRKVVRVDDDRFQLDNGTTLVLVPNEGCSGCGAGTYYLDEICKVNNVITNVELNIDVTNKNEPNDTTYTLFVICEGLETKEKLLSVSGNDDNGYYGTGFYLEVIFNGD